MLCANLFVQFVIYFFNLIKGQFQKKEKKLIEFSIKGADPASQHLHGKQVRGTDKCVNADLED